MIVSAKRAWLYLPALLIAAGCSGTKVVISASGVTTYRIVSRLQKCAPYQPALDPGVAPPRLVRKKRLRMAGIAGLPYACVTFTVNVDGNLEGVRVESTNDDQAAAAFVRTLTAGAWKPARKEGEPVAARIMRVFAVRRTLYSSPAYLDVHWYLTEDSPRR